MTKTPHPIKAAKSRTRRFRFRKPRLIPFLFVCWLSALAGLAVFFWTLPDIGTLKGCLTTSMFNVKLCPGSKDYVRLNEVSKVMKHAVLLAEDYGFYSHDGLDLDSLEDSLKANLQAGRAVRGGSTITQQLVKNVYLTGEKTILRKLREAVLAWRVEQIYKKDELFERYLNVVQFGKDLFGVKAAARHYFGKHPSELNALEAAFLAMLLPSPEKYSTSFRKGALTPFARKSVVTLVRKLTRKGTITPFQYIRAMALVDNFPWKGVSLEILPEETGATASEIPGGLLPEIENDTEPEPGSPETQD